MTFAGNPLHPGNAAASKRRLAALRRRQLEAALAGDFRRSARYAALARKLRGGSRERKPAARGGAAWRNGHRASPAED